MRSPMMVAFRSLGGRGGRRPSVVLIPPSHRAGVSGENDPTIAMSASASFSSACAPRINLRQHTVTVRKFENSTTKSSSSEGPLEIIVAYDANEGPTDIVVANL